MFGFLHRLFRRVNIKISFLNSILFLSPTIVKIRSCKSEVFRFTWKPKLSVIFLNVLQNPNKFSRRNWPLIFPLSAVCPWLSISIWLTEEPLIPFWDSSISSKYDNKSQPLFAKNLTFVEFAEILSWVSLEILFLNISTQ